MGADFDAAVEHGTDYLYGQGAHNDAQRETGHVQLVKQIEQGCMADDAQHVGHITALTVTYFVTGPAVELAVHENAQMGQEHGEKVNNKRQQQFGNYRQQIEVAEGEQNHKCHDRQIKRREYQRHHLGRKHQPRNAVLAVKVDGRVNLFDRVVHEFTLFVEILIRFYP